MGQMRAAGQPSDASQPLRKGRRRATLSSIRQLSACKHACCAHEEDAHLTKGACHLSPALSLQSHHWQLGDDSRRDGFMHHLPTAPRLVAAKHFVRLAGFLAKALAAELLLQQWNRNNSPTKWPQQLTIMLSI